MVKLKGPSLSLAAAGALGDSMVFSTWKGRPYAKKLTTPTNPKSPGQVGVRAMLRFLALYWVNLTSGAKLQWIPLATEANISPYNAWCRYCLDMWHRFKLPTQSYPGYTSPLPGILDLSTATALNRSIVIHLRLSNIKHNFGYRLHRQTSSGYDTAVSNCIRIDYWRSPMALDLYWTDGPLEPATYYYTAETFDSRGNSPDLWATEFNATIS